MSTSNSDRDQHTEVGHDSHEHADHGGNGKYMAVFVALCVLTDGLVPHVLPVLARSTFRKQASRR